MATVQELHAFIVEVKGELTGHSTSDGTAWSDEDYARARARFHSEPRLRGHVPEFFLRCRNLGEFWQFIKHKFASYRERRDYLKDVFAPFLDELERDMRSTAPSFDVVTETLALVDSTWVTDTWTKAMERIEVDPDGAITSARALLETVCKHILDGLEEAHADSDDLPDLYGKVAKRLNLSPSLHEQEVFKRILGGCTSVVHGLGSLRNKLGDAHGKPQRAVRPSARHARLAVNLAGTMAAFLVETWEYKLTIEAGAL